ncbi:MAG: NAD(P)/FAD-dependent oxidoreductase [Candidatus Eremiobacteraeota bacterium]|nr:NAD(P)/FAD-dependent oxidoreductase [Candidatus Eremiobacteraeota bacterium]
MSKDSQTRVLIVGAGFAGMKAAQVLGRRKNIQVTLVDRNNYHLFQPLLYQVASTGLNPSEISSTVRHTFRKRKNVKVLRAELNSIDKKKKVASFNDNDFTLEYDYLVLCVGGRTCYFGNNQWEEKAPGLKSLEDAVNIRNRLLKSLEDAERLGSEVDMEQLTSVVVIGGGPTGVELAGAFAELRSKVLNNDYRSFEPKNVQVTLIEAGPGLLNGYDEKSSKYTRKRLEKLGVTVLLNEGVTDISDKGVTTKERFLPSTNVIWAAGVEGHPLARMVTDKIDNRGRVLVTPELLIEGETDIYACGDMTYFGHDERFPRGLPGVAPAAIQQGERAARNILAGLDGKESKKFEYFDKGKMATIGRSAAVAEAGPMKMRGFLAWCAWLFIHLLYLVEFQDRVIVFMRWIWSYITWQWGVRIIFGAGEPDVKLTDSHPAVVENNESTETAENSADEGEEAEASDEVPESDETVEEAEIEAEEAKS